jgi:hypothetical protein
MTLKPADISNLILVSQLSEVTWAATYRERRLPDRSTGRAEAATFINPSKALLTSSEVGNAAETSGRNKTRLVPR